MFPYDDFDDRASGKLVSDSTGLINYLVNGAHRLQHMKKYSFKMPALDIAAGPEACSASSHSMDSTDLIDFLVEGAHRLQHVKKYSFRKSSPLNRCTSCHFETPVSEFDNISGICVSRRVFQGMFGDLSSLHSDPEFLSERLMQHGDLSDHAEYGACEFDLYSQPNVHANHCHSDGSTEWNQSHASD